MSEESRVVLSRTAPWVKATGYVSRRLQNTYRERFTEVAGRKFRVSASGLNSLWDIEEIAEDGELLVRAWTRDENGLPVPVIGYVDHAFTLAEARRKIAEEVARGGADSASVERDD